MQYIFIDNPSQLDSLKEAVRWITASDKDSPEPNPERLIGVDTETTGLNPFKCQVRLIQIAVPGFALIVDLDAYRDVGVRQVDWTRPGLNYIKTMLEGVKRPKVFQNITFDLNFLWQEGIDVGGELHDTMIAAKIINNGIPKVENNLGAIHFRELGIELPKEEQRADWAGVITKSMLIYAARDAECLTRIMPLLLAKLKKSRVTSSICLYDVYHDLEQPSMRPISRIQKNGFAFDTKQAVQLRSQLQLDAHNKKNQFCEKLDAALRRKFSGESAKWLPRDPDGSFNLRIKDTGSIRAGTKLYKGFNPGSPSQVINAFTDAGVVLRPNNKGKLSLDQNLLAFLAPQYPLICAYLEMKEALTLDTYLCTLIKAVEADGKIHSNYRQLGTRTGRMSSSDINIQQVPRKKMVRQLFQASPGWVLIVADYKAMELRMAAELSGESRMLRAFLYGDDMHKATASLMMGLPLDQVTYEMRNAGKVCNFALLYGAGAGTLQKQAISTFGLSWSKQESMEYVQRFRKAYPELKAWQDTQGASTTEAVLTKYGRRRFLFGADDKYTTRLNSPCQGSCGDVTKIAIVMLEKKMLEDDSARLVCTIHDELVIEARPEKVDYWAKTLQSCMEDAGSVVCTKVVLEAEVSVGDDWSAK